MTTQVAPAEMSMARLGAPPRSLTPTVKTAPALWVSDRTKSWVVPSSISAKPTMKRAAQMANWATKATGAVGASSASLPS